MEDIIIQSADFNPENSNLQQLVLELDETGYQYAIVQNQSLKLVGYHPSHSFSHHHDLFKSDFAQVKVSIMTKSFTFIPELHFNEAIEAKLKAIIGFDPYQESVFKRLIPRTDIHAVYTFKHTQIEEANRYLQDAKLYPQFIPLYVGTKQLHTETSYPEMFLNFKKEHGEVLILKHGELFFYNIFEIKNQEELKYFLMLIIQEKHINTKETPLKLSGNIDSGHVYFNEITHLFTDVTLIKDIPFITADENFTEAPLHHFFSLLSMALCE
ncbi:DUF3822 family protein [Pedobacter glucosidilyticus]|uniref:DUF3822 family protein n=1 Tax=Pedobacter glucosidilyticus TaxID=1122941 RepID=UPI0026EA1B0B|nr:DUF3822 family protein [Pedobacter glucosidilyticus]